MRFAVIALVLGALYLVVPNQAHAARAPLVLVLNSYHPQYGWTEELVRGVRDDLAALPPENLHIEFMDARRMVDDAKYLDLLAAVYQHKYGRLRPDVIISSDDSALSFLLARRDTLFPGVPIVFCGINSRAPEELEAVPNMTGILEGLDVAENLTLIERLQPNARRVVLLADRTSLGQGMVQVARGAIERRQRSALKTEIWDDFTLEELGRRVASVDEHTVFLLLAIHEDRAGRYFSFDEDLKPLTLRSRAPIYAMFGMLLGQGVVGGMMNDPYQHGRATAGVRRCAPNTGRHACRCHPGRAHRRVPTALRLHGTAALPRRRSRSAAGQCGHQAASIVLRSAHAPRADYRRGLSGVGRHDRMARSSDQPHAPCRTRAPC
jgi:hypothetical protein